MTASDDRHDDAGPALALASALRSASSIVALMVDEHEQYFEEILSTVLLAEIGRWYRVAVTHGVEDAPRDARSIVTALADLYATGDDWLQTVIVTGFLEAMPQPHDADRAVVESLPPVLRQELRKMEDWRPSGGG